MLICFSQKQGKKKKKTFKTQPRPTDSVLAVLLILRHSNTQTQRGTVKHSFFPLEKVSDIGWGSFRNIHPNPVRHPTDLILMHPSFPSVTGFQILKVSRQTT